MNTATGATMTAAEARQSIRDHALQWPVLAQGMVSAICDRLETIEFDDALNIAAHATAIHGIAQRYQLVVDEPSMDAVAEFRAALARLSVRLEEAVRCLDAADVDEALTDEIAALGETEAAEI
jgi:hypothetical protein